MYIDGRSMLILVDANPFWNVSTKTLKNKKLKKNNSKIFSIRKRKKLYFKTFRHFNHLLKLHLSSQKAQLFFGKLKIKLFCRNVLSLFRMRLKMKASGLFPPRVPSTLPFDTMLTSTFVFFSDKKGQKAKRPV
jgi:hypothetical protein